MGDLSDVVQKGKIGSTFSSLLHIFSKHMPIHDSLATYTVADIIEVS